jgi:N12 class adenine-specific DNA methylase
MADGNQAPAAPPEGVYDQAAGQYGVDPQLLRAVTQVESGGDPNAYNEETGAAGPQQIIPDTARRLGITDPTDWTQAVNGTAKLLRENYDRYQNPAHAIMAYHGGTDQKNWGPKTQDYLQRISNVYGPVLKNPFEWAPPKKGEGQGGLNFDDLIPEKGKKQLELSFDDLVPPRGALAVGTAAGAQGLVTGTGDTLKGMAELDIRRQALRPYWDMIQSFPAMTEDAKRAAERDLMRSQREGKISDITSLTVRRILRGLDPAPASFDELAPPPQETALGKAGERVKQFGEREIPVSEEERKAHPYAAGIGEAVGSTIPAAVTAIGASVLGAPEVGVPIAAAQMGLMSASGQAEAARKALGDKAATPEGEKTVQEAAQLGAVSGTALGAIPFHAITRPIQRSAPGLMPWVAAKLRQAAKNGLTFAGVNEAQEWLGKEIAKEFYDPEAGYSPDVVRIVSSLAGGAALGLPHPVGKPGIPEGARPAAKPQAQPQERQEPTVSAPGTKPEPPPPPPPGAPGAMPAANTVADLERETAGEGKMTVETLPQQLLQQAYGMGTFAPAANFHAAERDMLAEAGIHPITEEDGSVVYNTTPLIDEVARRRKAGELRKDIGQYDASHIEAWQAAKRQASGSESAPLTKIARQNLADLGYSAEQIGSISPAEARQIIKAGTRAGSPDKPITVKSEDDLALARDRVAENPSTAQVEGNSATLAHIRFDDMPGVEASIETKKGGERYDRKNAIPDWRVKDFPADYGRFKGTRGADGDEVDGYFGTGPKNFVIDQMNPETGRFDEHKVMKGFDSEQAALDVYRRAFSDGSANERIGAVSPVSSPDLAAWLKSGKTTKPFDPKLEPRAPRPPEGPASPQSIIGDIDRGRVSPNPEEVAARYGIGRDDAARLMHQVYQRPDSPIMPRSAPEDDPTTWTWQKVPADRREARIRDIEDWAHQEFGLDRSQYPSDVEFIDAAMVEQHQAVQRRLQPIRDEAAKQGIALTEDEALDVEHAVQQGHALSDAIHDAVERGGLKGEGDFGTEASQHEDIPHEWQTTIAPHPELAPPGSAEPPEPRRAPAAPEPGAAGRGEAAGAEPGSRAPHPGGEAADRVGQLEAERLADERGEKTAGSPAQSFEAIERQQREREAAAPTVSFDDLTTDYGGKNTVFTKSAAEAARERIRAKLGRLNAGFDPEMMLDGLTLAGFHVEAGARKFADYARVMAADLGEAVKPYLGHWYKSVRDYPGFDAQGMDDDAAIARHLKAEPEAVAPIRPVDSHKNPIFKKGERVAIPEDGGHMPGRHGEVTEAHGITMQAIFGGTKETSYHYTVKTDQGATAHASKLIEETERPTGVVPDPMVDGVATHPKQLASSIGYAARQADQQKAAAGRAIKPERKSALREAAAQSEREAQKLRAILENWKRLHPEEAARQFPAKSGELSAAKAPEPGAPEAPRPPDNGIEVRQNAEKGGVEIQFKNRPDDATLAQIKAAGFRWSKPQKLWWARHTPERLELANRIAGKAEIQKPSVAATERIPSTPAADAEKRALLAAASFYASIDRTGAARAGDTDYRVVPIGNFFGYERTKGGSRVMFGGDLQWSRQGAAVKALDDAFPPEAPTAPAVDNAPRQTVDRLKPGEKPDWTEIGKNATGHTLYQDQRGVRSYVVNGTRHTEPVGMQPTRGGVEFNVDRGAHPDWAVVESKPATPTARVEQQAQAQGARAEMDAAEGQTAAMPITTAATADPGIPEAERFKPGDAVMVKFGPAEMFAGKPRVRQVVSVSDDGRFVTLDGGLEAPHEALERQPEGSLPGEAGAPTSKLEAGHGVQGPVHAGDAGAGAGNVQRAGARGQAGQLRPGEERGGASAPGAAAGAGAEGRGRPAAGSAGAAPGRGAGDGRDAGLPAAGKPEEPGAAGRSAAAKVQGRNLTLAPGEVEEGRGPVQKARDNLEAIKLAKQILREDRPATREEQIRLAKYVGWGGLSKAFDPHGAEGGLGEVGRELKKVLTPTEYETAKRSTQYAHYTSEGVIRAMWDAMRQLGFKGGSVFEPGMGVGHFAGMMPPDLAAKSRYEGLEFDHLTAKIAKLIYPESGVRQADYTRTPMPENSFDVVIGNPPFSDTTIHADPKYSARNFMLHDYFFAKSLDSVRPGGLLGFVTSAGTMNKIDPAARRYLAERAEFLGGVRLPSTAFKQNAGTEVTTDILFFKKRAEPVSFEGPGAEPVPAWTETMPRELPGPEGAPTQGNVNRYFSEHPEQVLGRETFADTLYGSSGRYAIFPRDGEDLPTALREAVDRLPRDVMAQPLTPEQRAIQDLQAPERKDGSFYLKDGELYQYRGGAGRPAAKRGNGSTGMTAQDYERVKRLIPMRDALRDVFRADLGDDAAGGKAARQRLNEHYDAFVQKYGPINKAEFRRQRPSIIQQEGARAEAREDAREDGRPWREGDFDPTPFERRGAKLAEIARARADARAKAAAEGRAFDEGSFEPDEMADVVIERRPNINPFMDDPESYRLRAIEEYNDATGASRKKRIFYESVLTREEDPVLASANDGVLWSLNKHGRLDLDAIAAKMGKDRDSVITELGDSVFRVPGTDGVYHTADEYLSGDVIDKLADARRFAQHDQAYQRNVEALERVQPKPLAPSEISITIGMPWIPSDVVRDFARDHIQIGDLKVEHNKLLGGWQAEARTDGPNSAKWGTQAMGPFDILRAALNRVSPRVYKEIRNPDGSKGREHDPVASQAAQDKVDAMRQAFREFVEKSPERQEQLSRLYNEKYNRVVLRQYDGSYLTTPGISADWRWRPHQQRGVARIVLSGNTYIAHAVGAGKTSLYIGAGMEMRRLGLVRKPLYIVPNHMLGQFAKEFYEQYPLAKIAIADERNFHTTSRRQFIANVAQDDLDGVVMTHSSFGMIPISDDFQRHLIDEELGRIEEALSNLDEKNDRFTVKRLENQKEKLEQKLQGAFSGKRDLTQTFEEMGVDFLFVDEAHMFRKLQFATRQSSLKGIDPDGSNRAWDLMSKVRYLESRRPGRSAVLGSGTPVTNTMGELYSISRYLQPQELERRGIGHFDSWASTFGDLRTAMEQTAEGAYQYVTRFARFVNIPELYKMVGSIMDVVTPHQLDQYVVRPKLKGGKREMHLAPKTDALAGYQQGLAERVAAIKDRKGPPKKGDDILLSVIHDGRHAAVDMRYVPGYGQSDPESKLNHLVRTVHDVWQRTKDVQFFDPASNYQKPAFRGPATQMVFMNFGVNPRNGFSGYDWLRRELVRRGVPKEQIAFIKDYKSHVQKQKLFNDMNEGKVRVLIGSTDGMGTGVNAQRRLYAVHNEDPLWFPSDDEQRNGRILRQGNFNPEIEIHDYSTKGTYDSTMWQLMGNKGRFIEQFFRGDPTLRDMEDLGEASQYEQAAAISTADERIIQLTDLKHRLDRAERRRVAHEREQFGMRHDLEYARARIRDADSQEKAIELDIKKRQDTAGDAFRMKVGDDEFTKRKEAAAALEAEIMRVGPTIAKDGATAQVGELGGFPVVIRRVDEMDSSRRMQSYYLINLKMSDGDLMRIETHGAGAMGSLQSAEYKLRNFEANLEAVRQNRFANKQRVAALEKEVGKTFDRSEEDQLRKDASRLETAIAMTTKWPDIEKRLPSEMRAKAQQQWKDVSFQDAMQRFKDDDKEASDLFQAIFKAVRDSGIGEPSGDVLESVYNRLTGRPEAVPVETPAISNTPPKPPSKQISLLQRAPGFFSPLERSIATAKVASASPDAWKGFIRNQPGIKAEEVQWSGVNDWLDKQSGPVTRERLLEQIRQNNVQVEEVKHGGSVPAAAIDAVGEWVKRHNPAWLRTFDSMRRSLEDGDETVLEHLQNMAVPAELLQPIYDNVSQGPTKYGAYTLPGGRNYRELLLTLPPKTEPAASWTKVGAGPRFTTPHWDEENVLAHVRFDDRTDADGKKTLHIAELQSDWHQKGRREGYAEPGDTQRLQRELEPTIPPAREALKRNDNLGFDTVAQALEAVRTHPDWALRWDVPAEDHGVLDAYSNAWHRWNASKAAQRPAPAPFKATWHELAMKRMLRYAAENGYDRLTWDTGETNAARFDLSKHVDSILHRKNHDGTFEIRAEKGGKTLMQDMNVPAARLPDIVGKDVADKIIRGEGEPASWHEYAGAEKEHKRLSGLDLKVGGQGMRGFYDKILPEFVNRYAKKWGARVGETTLKTGEGALVRHGLDTGVTSRLPGPKATVHSVDITPEMRRSVMEGQAQFQRHGMPDDLVIAGHRHGFDSDEFKKLDREWRESSAKVGAPDEGTGTRFSPHERILAAQLAEEGGTTPAQIGEEGFNRAAATQGLPGNRNRVAALKTSPVYEAKRAEIAAAVQGVLKRMAPGATVEEHRGLIEGQGYGRFQTRETPDGLAHVIGYSLKTPDATGTARHEVIHYLRHSGLLRPEEWATLEKAAQDGNWLTRKLKSRQSGEVTSIAERYADLPHDLQVEESIAHEFQRWRRDGMAPQVLKPIFEKIDRFLRQVAAAVRRILGKDATADDIFTRIESGEVGRRPPVQEPGHAIALQQREIPGTTPETPEQVAARQRQQQKEEAELRMRGRKGAGKAQETVDGTPLFGGKGQGSLFQLEDGEPVPADEPPEGSGPFHKILSKLPGPVRLAEAANAGIDFARSLTRAISPMAMPAGRFEPTQRGARYKQSDWIVDARATAFDFAATQRASAHEWGAIDAHLNRTFDPTQRQAMYDALDEMSVAAQQGKPVAGLGVDTLPKAERDATLQIYNQVKQRFEMARRFGVHDIEGLPWYAPRMLLDVGTPDARVVRDIRTLALAGRNLDKAIIGKVLLKSIEKLGQAAGVETVRYGSTPAVRGLDRLGANITTTSPQLRERKYLTREETEAAAAHVQKSTERPWFTMPGHPAFQRRRPVFELSEETGARTRPR